MGHRLRQQRTLLGLTREEFAELADISAGYYGQIEVGTSQMSIDTLIKLSKTSQLSMEYILLGEEIQPDADLTASRGCFHDLGFPALDQIDRRFDMTQKDLAFRGELNFI